MKYPNVTLGRVEAVWNKLGGEEGVDKFLSGKLVVQKPVCSWREEDGVIYFTVTSDGTTGSDWIKRLEKKGFRLSKWAKDVLGSSDFKPTSGVAYQIAVLKGTLFTDSDRITKKIRAEAERRKLEKPNAEVACLIREMFSDEDLEVMGLYWIVVFHEPIKDSGGDLSLLNANRDNEGRWLSAYYDKPDDNWNSANGFAFALPQIALFLSHFLREFSFISLPNHPPRFLPMSFNLSDKAIYFLLSSDFVSHSIIKNTFSISSLRIAKRINGCFSLGSRKLAVTIPSITSTKILSIFSPRENLCCFGIIW